MDETNRKPNRLINEKSPYLLQHAYNPVDWHPWGDEAFGKARSENKPVFLSIGYSTCHWCHVMEHESFMDDEVAALLNKYFICIKVDREERPDIDSVYMNVCQMLTGSGGWPLTLALTADRKPFYASTYIPKNSAYGRIGLMELLPRIVRIWTENKMTLVQTSNDITEKIEQSAQEPGTAEPGGEIFTRTYNKLATAFDNQYAGFGQAPKFPMPHQLTFLLRYYQSEKAEPALTMVLRTLEAMRYGGIYDQAGGGFHRYSTDAGWLVPHFEKMLYDQALLTIAYTEAYQVKPGDILEETVHETVGYVLRDLAHPDGAFYSAEDADSDGIEGKFYLWTKGEIDSIIEDKDFLCKAFSIQEEGNFQDPAGHSLEAGNILHFSAPVAELARQAGLSPGEFKDRLAPSLSQLFMAREKRVRPFRDDKILTDWNGLMIAALSKAAAVFDRPDYLRSAEKAWSFIGNNLTLPDGRLLHRFRDGEASGYAGLDDYAFMIWGLLELYEASFNPAFLEDAVKAANLMIGDYYDEENGGFFLTSNKGEQLIARPKELYDGAVPSGNSVALMSLIRLQRITSDEGYREVIDSTIRLFTSAVDNYPRGYTQFLNAFYYFTSGSVEIVICGESCDEQTKKMIGIARSGFVPNRAILLQTSANAERLAAIAPYTKTMSPSEGRPRAYVCRNFTCSQPVSDADGLAALMSEPSRMHNYELRITNYE